MDTTTQQGLFSSDAASHVQQPLTSVGTLGAIPKSPRAPIDIRDLSNFAAVTFGTFVTGMFGIGCLPKKMVCVTEKDVNQWVQQITDLAKPNLSPELIDNGIQQLARSGISITRDEIRALSNFSPGNIGDVGQFLKYNDTCEAGLDAIKTKFPKEIIGHEYSWANNLHNNFPGGITGAVVAAAVVIGGLAVCANRAAEHRSEQIQEAAIKQQLTHTEALEMRRAQNAQVTEPTR
ncbi:MAG: hypothetical protein EAY65_02945 [Alphaproteobacteria bacterium]|nr:MAG: hypothetical protein EAY65_02945 [Alphaproteobacteria bacterium]